MNLLRVSLCFILKKQVLLSDIFDDIELHEVEYKSLNKTEKESIVRSRVGQGYFRECVIKLWGGCAVTGIENPLLLRASHIKPWRDSNNLERLDPMNGLLLVPTLDHLFDAGLITFSDDGIIKASSRLSNEDMKVLHVSNEFKLRIFPPEAKHYMEHHRNYVFIN